MNPYVSAITLGVKDIRRAKLFYSEGLGWPIGEDHGAFVSFNVGDSACGLGLFTCDGLAADAGVSVEACGFHGLTLSYLVPSNEHVDNVLA